MKSILKIGDPVYSQSIKGFTPSNLEGFPQREQYLLEHVKAVEIDIFKHSVLSDIEDVVKERKRLKEFLSDKKFDYVMVDNPLSALVVDKDVGIPILFDCIDWYDEIYLTEFGVDKRYHLLRYGLLDLLERAKKVVAQSPVILDALQSWGLKTKDTVVIPNGYDSRMFHRYTPEKIESVRRDLALKFNKDLTDKSLIVYTGKLSAWHEAIKTVAEAIEEDQVFFIVGDGPLLKEIPEKDNIVKCGSVPLNEVPDFTNAADVLVFPVDSDCSPIVISEYLAVGKPIIMPKGRMEWLLEDGHTGYMVDNNAYSWKAGIQKAIERQETCSDNNAKLAKDLSWQTLAKKFSAFVKG